MMLLCWTIICGIVMFRSDVEAGTMLWIVGILVGGLFGGYSDD